MNKTPKIIIFGFLTWLIPILISFLFYLEDGRPAFEDMILKIVMLSAVLVTGIIFSIIYLKDIKKDRVKEGVLIGLIWFIINIFLDFIILDEFTHILVGPEFVHMELRYLILPFVSTIIAHLNSIKLFKKK